MSGFIFLIWAMLCQHPDQYSNTIDSTSTQVSTTNANGDTGHVPPKPPSPPAP